jgi:HAD superfamily phosphatase (TIGR01668 family)
MAIVHPQRYVTRIECIDVDELVAQGVRCVLLDRDNTCVPRDTKVAPPEVAAWLKRVRAAGIKTCIVSNNFHSKQVEQSARELGCEVVHHALKPAPFALWRALRLEGSRAKAAVMIGDQILTDVLAGNLAGIQTILVRPQCRRDLWFALPARAVEHFLLKGRVFEGEGDAA